MKEGGGGGVGVVTETPPSLFTVLSFTSSLYLFPLLNLASGHSPPQKAGTFIPPSSFPSIHPTRCLFPVIIRVCTCVCRTSDVTAGVDVLFQR